MHRLEGHCLLPRQGTLSIVYCVTTASVNTVGQSEVLKLHLPFRKTPNVNAAFQRVGDDSFTEHIY